MIVKKSKGKVYGASLTAAEKKAMDIEIKRQLAEYERQHQLELDAIILWVLRNQLGFGKKRLKRFYDEFSPAVQELLRYYEMGEEDQSWLCTRKLKDHGVDIEKWQNER